MDPSCSNSLNNLAVCHYEQGDYETAKIYLIRLVQQNPKFADAWNNLGLALAGQGKLESAVRAYDKAIACHPDFLEAFNNMGQAFKKFGNLEVAIECFKKAISIDNKYQIAWENLGQAYQLDKQYNAAVSAYKTALSLKANRNETYKNLVISLYENGNLPGALEACRVALLEHSGDLVLLRTTASLLKRLVFTSPSKEWQKIILDILEQKTLIRPDDAAPAAISLIKLDPTFENAINLMNSKDNWMSYEENFFEFINDPLFLKLLELCPINDVQLERVVVELRKFILFNLLNNRPITSLANFQVSLALQCFINEYVYQETEAETDAVLKLGQKIEALISNNEQPSSSLVLCMAAFRPLAEFNWYNLIKETEHIARVYTQQITEPQREKELKSGIKTNRTMKDNVSLKVRSQYEDNPYPRWTEPYIAPRAMHICETFSDLNIRADLTELTDEREPTVLIAGCGTGRHSIESAFQHKDADILAIDLSLSSLAYAKRKTEEFGLKNIHYMQCDILDLKKLGRKFDIIESSGVIHHMADPIQGWSILNDCLKNHGVCKLGLYSALARKNIVKIKEEIARLGYSPEPKSIREFRKLAQTSEQVYFDTIRNSHDFNSMSSLRDLAFHEQEYHFTIPEIKGVLDKLSLSFCGFVGSNIVSNFRKWSSDEDDLYNLDKWADFEKENPNTFNGMYQFWYQKNRKI